VAPLESAVAFDPIRDCDLLQPHGEEPLVVDSPITASLAALSRFFVGDGTVMETLERVSDLTVEAVPAAEMVGITMLVEGRQRTAVFTDPEAVEIDQAQYETGDGPCLEAFREGHITEIESTREPGRWGQFRKSAAAHGIGSTLSFPLLVDTTAVGALNLYARPVRGFTDADRETGTLFAAQAAIVLANTQAYWDAHELSLRLGEAMQSRAVIEQAKGILMGAQGFDEDAAFAMLVAASQRENVKLRDIAHRIVKNAANGNRPAADGSPDPAVENDGR
jgi:GAF domain-containing protein